MNHDDIVSASEGVVKELIDKLGIPLLPLRMLELNMPSGTFWATCEKPDGRLDQFFGKFAIADLDAVLSQLPRRLISFAIILEAGALVEMTARLYPTRGALTALAANITRTE